MSHLLLNAPQPENVRAFLSQCRRYAHINFADLFIFGHWKLDTRPALLIGMDVRGVLDTLVIDYRRQELQIRTR